MGILEQMTGEPMHKRMYGEHAKHVPCWMIAQSTGNGVSFVGASKSSELMFNSSLTHVCMIGEMIARPHLVLESDRFTGQGLAGLVTTSTEWMQQGYSKVALDVIGKMSAGERTTFDAAYVATKGN